MIVITPNRAKIWRSYSAIVLRPLPPAVTAAPTLARAARLVSGGGGGDPAWRSGFAHVLAVGQAGPSVPGVQGLAAQREAPRQERGCPGRCLPDGGVGVSVGSDRASRSLGGKPTGSHGPRKPRGVDFQVLLGDRKPVKGPRQRRAGLRVEGNENHFDGYFFL